MIKAVMTLTLVYYAFNPTLGVNMVTTENYPVLKEYQTLEECETDREFRQTSLGLEMMHQIDLARIVAINSECKLVVTTVPVE